MSDQAARPATEAIDRLFLELSQFTRATTEKEMRMIEAEALRCLGWRARRSETGLSHTGFHRHRSHRHAATARRSGADKIRE